MRWSIWAMLVLWALTGHAQTTVDVAPVWSVHPVGFALLTQGEKQFAGYYDPNREMTIAGRDLSSTEWTFTPLGERVIWDSHGYISLAVDEEGYLHVGGNMHMSPLVYFRSELPLDATTLKRRESMTGTEEVKITYPEFIHEGEGLLFFYRHGESGRGNEIINRYKAATKVWQRVNFKPLTDGEGVRNAYFDKFQRGPDGLWHVCWVWRNEADVATTNTLCYARTKDFRNWENVRGEKLSLPLKITADAIVDPVPPHSGMVNGNTKLAFTADGRPVIAYHKNDATGTQVHAAGWDGTQWVVTALTSYDYFWKLEGKGTLVGEMGVRRPRTGEDGRINIQWTHAKFGMHRRTLDPATFTAGPAEAPLSDGITPELRKVESSFPEMVPRFAWDSGGKADTQTTWLLRWETLPANRDEPRPQPWPEPSMLRVHEVPRPEIGN